MRYSLLLTLFSLVLGSTLIASEVDLGGMKSKIPDGWKEEKPENKMRLAQFKLPKAEGETDDAELVIFTFPGGSGTVEQNLQRQRERFAPGEGKKELEEKIEKIKVGKIESTVQDLKGAFKFKKNRFDPNEKPVLKPDYRQLYVVVITDKADYYISLLGSNKTIEKHKKDFDEWLKNFK